MDNNREKLMDLVYEGKMKRIDICYNNEDCSLCEYSADGEYCCDGVVADHLLANGVVVQRWIPASEPPTVTGEYIAMIRGDVHPTSLYYSFEDEKWFLFRAEDSYDVTHWMPLPEPPKEGE